MRQYLTLLTDILENGETRLDRTGTGTESLFGRQICFDLSEGFPIVTTKEVNFKAIVYELLWFLRGDTNIKYLNDHGVHIWDNWADEEGNLEGIYGKQWRAVYFEEVCPLKNYIDQIANVIKEIKINPTSRRLIIDSWNVWEIEDMALPPCHCLFQFYVSKSKLSCHLYQRSADIFLGVPFNIASYALLTHLIAQVTGLEAGELIISYGDVHLYTNHIEQAYKQFAREPYPLPTLQLDKSIKDIDDFRFEHISLVGYRHHERIKGEVSI